MPLPLSDISQAYRSAPEKTEQALTKVGIMQQSLSEKNDLNLTEKVMVRCLTQWYKKQMFYQAAELVSQMFFLFLFIGPNNPKVGI